MRYLALTGIMCLLPFSASANLLKGKVIDQSTKEALIGVSVSVKGNPGIGTITDVDGNFSLDVNAAKATLELTYVGYVTKEISLSEDKQGMVVEMNEDNFKLDEVVVTG